jgi:hypothetical protein
MDEQAHAWFIGRILDEKKRVNNSTDFTDEEKKMYIKGLMFIETLGYEYVHSED